MKKALGLVLVILLSSGAVYAQKAKVDGKSGATPQTEQMIKDLKLTDKQAADLKSLNEEFATKMKNDRESAKADRQKMRDNMKQMREDRNAKIKKILTDEQYQQYLKMEKDHHKDMRKGGKRGNRDKSND
jgi:Spy/CpxP family protein refolding chaperone